MPNPNTNMDITNQIAVASTESRKASTTNPFTSIKESVDISFPSTTSEKDISLTYDDSRCEFYMEIDSDVSFLSFEELELSFLDSSLNIPYKTSLIKYMKIVLDGNQHIHSCERFERMFSLSIVSMSSSAETCNQTASYRCRVANQSIIPSGEHKKIRVSFVLEREIFRTFMKELGGKYFKIGKDSSAVGSGPRLDCTAKCIIEKEQRARSSYNPYIPSVVVNHNTISHPFVSRYNGYGGEVTLELDVNSMIKAGREHLSIRDDALFCVISNIRASVSLIENFCYLSTKGNERVGCNAFLQLFHHSNDYPIHLDGTFTIMRKSPIDLTNCSEIVLFVGDKTRSTRMELTSRNRCLFEEYFDDDDAKVYCDVTFLTHEELMEEFIDKSSAIDDIMLRSPFEFSRKTNGLLYKQVILTRFTENLPAIRTIEKGKCLINISPDRSVSYSFRYRDLTEDQRKNMMYCYEWKSNSSICLHTNRVIEDLSHRGSLRPDPKFLDIYIEGRFLPTAEVSIIRNGSEETVFYLSQTVHIGSKVYNVISIPIYESKLMEMPGCVLSISSIDEKDLTGGMYLYLRS